MHLAWSPIFRQLGAKMAERTFQALEQAGWVARAAAYDDLFATITDQAIAPILDSFGDIADKRLLDVACGTGHIAGVAAERGAKSEGIDFASTRWQRQRSDTQQFRSLRVTPSNYLTMMRALTQSLVDSVCSTWRDRTE